MIDVVYIAPIVGVFLPILVGIVTKQVAHSGIKASLLAGLSAISGVLISAQEAGGLVAKEVIVAAFLTWVVAVATHYGFWKPTDVTGSVQNKTKDFGVG